MKIFFLLVGISLAVGSYAQTFSEWFNQKKTQIKYLEIQIAALAVYGKTLEKGYKIARDGLTMIGDIKKGDFNIHADYFTSLITVNPTIKSYWKVADLLTLEKNLFTNSFLHQRNFKKGGQLQSSEISYIETVYTHLLDGCTGILTQLSELLTDGSLSLKDDERIKRIDQLHDEMKDRYEFEQRFSRQVLLLEGSRKKDFQDVQVMKNSYSIQ